MTHSHSAPTAEVVLPIPVDTPYTYLVPGDLADQVRPGVQVIVPLGERFLAGIVLATGEGGDRARELRPIHDVVDERPFVGSDVIELLQWIADYYICHLGEAFRLINPAFNLKQAGIEVRRAGEGEGKASPALQAVLEALDGEEWVSLKTLQKRLPGIPLLSRIGALRRLGLTETRRRPPGVRSPYRTVTYLELAPESGWAAEPLTAYREGTSRKHVRANALIDLLQRNGRTARAAVREAGFSDALVKRLQRDGVVAAVEETVEREQALSFSEQFVELTLTPDQQGVVDAIGPLIDETPAFAPVLLHGITGSGKTQVYIELVRRTLAAGKSAIVLIPEIILTPQTMARFRNHFGEAVAMIHSRLSPAERGEVLHKIREGRFSVVVGPRSAVFAPFANLGLIVVDEEHEGSYKQSDGAPRYNARDVALVRARLNGIPIVLGSATPSLETLHNARSERYRYFHLGQRISERNLPRIQLVDFKEEWRRTGGFQLFSESLLLKIEARLLCREQSMLLLNRRGFSPFIMCEECGHVERCPACDITLTYHQSGRKLQCHYCNHLVQAPDRCPGCGGVEILFKGVGTQKVESEATAHFPHVRFLRMDQDTTRRKDDHARLLERFRQGEADVLIGTKMIAKGLDFEKVTLVGVMNADQGLNFPDFRASEKVFQLLVQAAGRAGRGAASGEVVIQTFDPDNYLFQFLRSHDYLAFYEKEIKSRETLRYPPFSRLCLIRVIGTDEGQVFHYGREIAAFLRQADDANRYSVLGPAPAPLPKIRNNYRYHIMIKQDRRTDPAMRFLRRLLKAGLYASETVRRWPVEVQIDVDPLDIL